MSSDAARLLLDPKMALAVLLIASAGILGTALASQYIGGLQPCVLCLYQRVPYAGAIAMAGYALAAAPAFGLAGLCGALGTIAVIHAAGAGVALFHVGVEQQWWQGTAACGGLGTGPQSLEELRRMILAAPVVRCDEPAWTLWGISMAGYNAVAALALAAFAAAAAWRRGA